MTAPLATPLVLPSDLISRENASVNAANTGLALSKIIEESQRLTDWAGRRFDERIETRYYTPRDISFGGDVLGMDLFLGADCKSVTTLTNGDGTVIGSSGYTLIPKSSDSNGVAAKSRIRLATTGGVYWSAGANDPVESISVLGTWGYGGQWKATGATVSSGLASDSSATTFVSSAALESGMTLKIDSEYLYIESTSGTNNTVTRAFNGSTAAVHANSTAIYRWESHPLVARCIVRLVLISILQDSNPLFSQLVLGDAVTAVASDAKPADVMYDVAKALRRMQMPLGV